MRALSTIVRERRIEVIHGYEWPPALEAYLVAQQHRVTAVATVMSMAVAPFIPRTMPLIVGTEQIAAAERMTGRSDTAVLEPPVDLLLNDVEQQFPGRVFPGAMGLAEGALTIVTVTRLAYEMKLEGLLAAIDAIDQLESTGQDLQLVIVGDGPARREVETTAARSTTCWVVRRSS